MRSFTSFLDRAVLLLMLVGVLDGRSVTLRPTPLARTPARAATDPTGILRTRARARNGARVRMAMGPSSSGDEQCASPSPELARHNALLDRFLVQRAVQTQIYYLHELRDGPSAGFLANFHEHAGIERYHGFDALHAEPTEYIDTLLASPPVVVSVRASWGSTSWRGSPGNPYMEQQREATHDITIYPDRIGASLLRVRDEIAEELTADLDLIAHEDIELWRHHDEVVRSGSPDDEGAKRAMPAFDGSALGDSTPTRRATFDLLKKLTLHVAIKETLRAMSRKADGDELPADHLWLESLFAQSGFLCGDQGFGTAEEFLNGVLGKEVKLVSRARADGEEEQHIIDPHAITNQVRAPPPRAPRPAPPHPAAPPRSVPCARSR